MWRHFSVKTLIGRKNSIEKIVSQSHSPFPLLYCQPTFADIVYTTCFRRGLCHVPNQNGERESSKLSNLRPQEPNFPTHFVEHDEQTKKDDMDSLFDQEDWQRIGDSEEVEEIDDFRGVSLQRGITGVFDIDEFVEILNQENLTSIAVIAVPPQLNYVDYMVVTTGKSAKQMTAVAEFLRKIFKKRCLPTDSLPVIEGIKNKDWIALDLGNIALHIFSSKARKTYDLETLWTCGAEFDDLSNQEDVLSSLMKEHSFPSQTS